jgi:metallothionein
MSGTIERVKCACSDCVCVVDVGKGVERDGKIYCGAECAEHHRTGAGCQHAGCTCHG